MLSQSVLTHPDLLDNRVRILRQSNGEGNFILYWMHHAMRVHENPALDAAILAANESGLPLLVYLGLSENYRYASDRHHSFILQGIREVQNELNSLGIPNAVHVARCENRGPWLKELTRQAALLVTEEMPVEPISSWIDRLHESTATGIWIVDSSCIVPMELVGHAYTRAFEFRRATRSLYPDRIIRKWERPSLKSGLGRCPDLPFETVNLHLTSIPELLHECSIDHGVGPVPETRGGNRAGYDRWAKFQSSGLARYARRRNDPLKDGVSRMSAYLHYGMVSPFRLAREAQASGGDGAEKYLDELLIWRELAWSFCRFRDDPESLSAIPEWARQSLQQHAQDERPDVFDWETLSRGQSGEALWDAAQTSLLKHGELHNNVRMTWGKALLHWTRDPQRALEMMIDLNHRYALDGRDPASYGGILWCLGQFDRPFTPEQPVIGTVRPRSVRQHAKRLDSESYRNIVDRPLSPSHVPSVAVIGAGLAGLSCARILADHGIPVTVFDKGRRPGGRMSTRLTRGGLQFDHGCQYFSVSDKQFERFVTAWRHQGLVEDWKGPFANRKDGCWTIDPAMKQRIVPVSGMSAICEHLGAGLTIRQNSEVRQLQRQPEGWGLRGDGINPAESYDWIVVAVPAPQAVPLLSDSPELANRSDQVPMNPCWTVMLSFRSHLPIDWNAGKPQDDMLAWVARDSSKPARDSEEDLWVLQASAEWSRIHLERPSDEVASALRDRFLELIGLQSLTPVHQAAHRWRHAIAHPPSEEQGREWCDADRSLCVCGDWTRGQRVETAFLSGISAAGSILRRIEA